MGDRRQLSCFCRLGQLRYLGSLRYLRYGVHVQSSRKLSPPDSDPYPSSHFLRKVHIDILQRRMNGIILYILPSMTNPGLPP